jgi:hypothetical protein
MANQIGERNAERRVAGPVRITLPARVAYNPEALKKSIVSVAEQLGCPSCFSGADCLLQMERDFVVNPEANASPVAGPQPVPWHVAGPLPDPWRVAGPQPEPWRATVGLASAVKYDLEKVLAAIDKVIDIIGPHPCISGADLLLKNELDLITVDAHLNAQRFDRHF